MRKFIILLIAIMLLLSPYEAYAIKKGTVDNLQPRSELNVSVEPQPRKIDLVIDNDLLRPSWGDVEKYVKAEIEPMLKAKGIDYRITYAKTSGYKQDPLYFPGGFVNDKGELWLRVQNDSSQYTKVTLPNNAKLVQGTKTFPHSNSNRAYGNYLLDDRGNLYCYENLKEYGPQLKVIVENSDYVKIIPRLNATYLLTSKGQVHTIENDRYYRNCNSNKINVYSDLAGFHIVDIASDENSSLLAVTNDGRVVGIGRGIYNPTDNRNTANGKIISGLSNIKQVELMDASSYEGKPQYAAYALTNDGEVYSWGSHPLGRSGNSYDIRKINIDERIAIIRKDVSSIVSKGYEHSIYFIAESGNVYQVRGNGVFKMTTLLYLDLPVYDIEYDGTFGTLFNNGLLRSVSNGHGNVYVSDRRESLQTSLSKASWRAGAERYYLHITDMMETTDAETMQPIIQKLAVDKIRYIGLTTRSVDAIKELIIANDHRGKVVEKTGDLALNFRHIGQYIVRNQAVDVMFHIGDTSQDQLRLIEQKLQEQFVPQIEQFGIELKLTVTDGERVPEDRIYYLDSSNHIIEYDPRKNTHTKIVDRPTASAMIHQSGDLFYILYRTVYRYNTMTGEETVYYELENRSYNDFMVVDIDGKIWYQLAGTGLFYYLYSIDPKTGELTRYGGAYGSPYSQPTPTALGGIYARRLHYSNSGYWYMDAFPGGSATDRALDMYTTTDGCRYYTYDSVQFLAPSGCVSLSGATGTVGGPAGDDGAIINHYPRTDEPAKITYYNRKKKTFRELVTGTSSAFLTTPSGRVYYHGTQYTHWVDWNTGQKGRLNIKLDRGKTILYHHHNIETRRLRKIPFTEGLQQTVWRTEADKFYVYMNDGTIPGLNGTSSRFWDQQISFVGMGTNSNRSQIQSFIDNLINGHGTFINNTQLDQAISELAVYILNQAGLPKYQVNEERIVLDYDAATGGYRSGKLIYETNYEDPENDPKYKERWVYHHDPSVYENPLGLLPEHGQTLTAPLTTLQRTGKYEISYEVSDRPKADSRFADFERWSEKARLNLYAHRRPIADFTAKITPQDNAFYRLELTDLSYDLDRQSKANRGITAREWKWMRFSELKWHNGKPPATIAGDDIYMISLRVRDEDGAWSDEKVITLLADAFNNAPVAKFTVTASIHRDQEITITDQSYDPDGDPIVERRWQVSKDGISIYSSSTRPTAATLRSRAESNGLSIYGVYTITLTVRDQPQTGVSLWSEPYHQSFTIVNRPPLPGFTWTPTTLYQGDSVQFKHEIDDPEKATLRVRYQVTAPNGNVSYYPSSTTYDHVSSANYKGNAFSISNLQGGDYTILQTVLDEDSSRTLTKIMHVIPNRPPVADFTWTPATIWEGDLVSFINQSSDPDGDELTYAWLIRDPNGDTYRSSMQHINLRLTQVGAYSVQLTVSDGRLSAQKTAVLHVRELTIEADVRHTERWLNYHLEAGHETNEHPKDFYTGESFILHAFTSSAPVRSVQATLEATDRSGRPLRVTESLRLVAANQYEGEMFDERFSSLTEGIANGIQTMRFRVEYANGMVKTTDVPIRIIGHVWETVGVHRRR